MRPWSTWGSGASTLQPRQLSRLQPRYLPLLLRAQQPDQDLPLLPASLSWLALPLPAFPVPPDATCACSKDVTCSTTSSGLAQAWELLSIYFKVGGIYSIAGTGPGSHMNLSVLLAFCRPLPPCIHPTEPPSLVLRCNWVCPCLSAPGTPCRQLEAGWVSPLSPSHVWQSQGALAGRLRSFSMQDLRSISDDSPVHYEDPLYLEDQVARRRPPIGKQGMQSQGSERGLLLSSL